MRADAIVFPFVLTTAASSRKEPERALRQLLGADPASGRIDAVLTSVLADGASRLTNKQTADAPTLYDILAGTLPAMLQVACRTTRGIWSERRGGEISRADFVTFVTPDLVDECSKAADAPRDAGEQTIRTDLIRAIQLELGVLWAHLLNTLPRDEDAQLSKNSERGRAFRHALTHLWKLPVTWERQQTANGGDSATRASLSSRVVSARKRAVIEGTTQAKWHAIHSACDGWWRDWMNAEGEIETLLAMRWTLGRQVGIDLPGVVDQDSLRRQADQFGLLRDAPPGVPTRLSGGTNRLLLLSLDLSLELLESPIEEPEETPEKPDADENFRQ
jgi:hypothetical protein